VTLSHPSWDDNWPLRKFAILSSFFHLVLHQPSGLFPWGFLAISEFPFRLPVCNSYPACITLPSFECPDTVWRRPTTIIFITHFLHYFISRMWKKFLYFFASFPDVISALRYFTLLSLDHQARPPIYTERGGECLVHSINLLVTLHQWN